MITIDFNSFWNEDKDLKDSTIQFVESISGKPDKITIYREVEEDEESNYSIFFNYKNYHLQGDQEGRFNSNLWEELKKFAKKNELYVIVYDHDSKMRFAYWYDENPSFSAEVIGDYLPYLKSI